MQWCKTHHTCTTEVPNCYAATGVRKTRWVHGTRNHHPSGGAHRLGILTCLLLESKWQAESLFGSPRCQQSYEKRPLQDTHCWRDNPLTGRKQEVYQGQWNLIIPQHSPWAMNLHYLPHLTHHGEGTDLYTSPGAYHVPRISFNRWWTRFWNTVKES